MGGHRLALQEHGSVGVLLLQVPASRLPVRQTLPRMSRTLWRRIQTNQRKAVARQVSKEPAGLEDCKRISESQNLRGLGAKVHLPTVKNILTFKFQVG